jgi:hypothetical protein
MAFGDLRPERLAVAAMIWSMAAGCSGQQPSTTTTFDRVPSRDQRLLYLAEEILVSHCMMEGGFEYAAIPAPGATPEARTYGTNDVDAARREGYRLKSDAKRAALNLPSDENARLYAALPHHRQHAYERALFGAPDGRKGSVTLPDGSTIGFGLDGCSASARETLYGSVERYMTLASFVDNLAIEVGAAVERDPRYITALGAWRNCMRERGFTYESPGEAADAAVAAPVDERQIAVADATCGRTSRIVEVGRRSERTHRAEVYGRYEAQVIAYYGLEASAVERAKRLVPAAYRAIRSPRAR